MTQAKGTFDIQRTAEPAADFGDGVQAMRLRFDKTFHGPLAATSVVHMLGVMDPATGCGGYVALERIVGTLDGHAGSFMLQHGSLMDHGAPQQSIRVIPGSGTDALAGLRGTMTIDIVDGAHHYTFDYALSG
jgi:hypothetical protein